MLKIGIIGLGARCKKLLKIILDTMSYVEISAICDISDERINAVRDIVMNKTGKVPFASSDYRELADSKLADGVLILTPWDSHIKMATTFMKSGIYVGMEVMGAYNLSECFSLVHTYRETNTPCMMLENCNFGLREMTLNNMIKDGFFGKIVHVEGGYHHDLRKEITYDGINYHHYRLKNYIQRNCDNYPTHALGPLFEMLNINRGNMPLYLVSTSSKSRGIKEYINEHEDDLKPLKNTEFKQGDIVTTFIKCSGGETITLTLDTTLPTFRSRGLEIRGTKGAYFENNHSIFLESVHQKDEFNFSEHYGNADVYFEKYKPDLWKKYETVAKESGYDGMNYMTLRCFFESILKKENTPLTVYDAALLMSVSPLSQKSIENGSSPVFFPDFSK